MRSFVQLNQSSKSTPIKNQWTCLLCLVAVVGILPLYGQQAPCSGPAYRQFDFWVGEWDVYHATADTIVGHNHIKNILNGCVIEENWTGGSGFQGKSFNTYSAIDSTWNQVWVDQGGNTYHFKGTFADNVMSMKGESVSPSTGGKVLLDMSYTYDPEKETVRQLWKASSDDGENWNTIFDGIYKRQ